jgi:hypothetical protein
MKSVAILYNFPNIDYILDPITEELTSRDLKYTRICGGFYPNHLGNALDVTRQLITSGPCVLLYCPVSSFSFEISRFFTNPNDVRISIDHANLAFYDHWVLSEATIHCARGQYDADYYIAHGQPSIVTGTPKYDPYASQDNQRGEDILWADCYNIEKPIVQSMLRTILVQAPHSTIYVKPHPNTSINTPQGYIQDLIGDLPIQILPEKHNIGPLLKHCKYVITPSRSVSLEAMACGATSILIMFGRDLNEPLLDSQKEGLYIHYFHDNFTLPTVVNRPLSEWYVKKYLCSLDGMASKRIVDLIEKNL